MSSEWFCTKLSSLGTFERGKSKHRPRDAAHLYNGPYPFIQTGDITASGGKITTYRQTYSEAGLAQSKLWPKNTLAITIAANIAETALLSFPACFPDSVVGFTAHPEKADVRFIEYLFRAMRENVKRRAYGSVQENINLMVLRDLEFPVPSLEVQKKIADFLSLLDDRIALLRETNKTLEAIAQAIFKSWFVDFDPVRAKQEGRDLEGMDADTAALFPDSFEESELGLIPKGWKVISIGDIANNNSSTFNLSNVDQVVFINTGDVSDGVFLHKNYTLKNNLPGQAKKSIQKDDILFSEIRPKNRRFAYVNFDPIDYVVSTKFMILRSIGHMHPRYLYQILRQSETIEYFNVIAESRSGTFPQITFDSIKNYKLIEPGKECLTKYIECISPIIKKNDLITEHQKLLEALRDTLLPRLISGQLRLPDAESIVKEATA